VLKIWARQGGGTGAEDLTDLTRFNEAIGLALYICREIVLAHGGELTIASTAEAGTTFSVSLPRQAA
jgi:signal transduction histidine kinase